MIEIASDFPLLGSREYIHGTTLLTGFLEALETRVHDSIVVKRIKFAREARSNGRLLLTDGALDEVLAASASCTFLATVPGATWRGIFVDEGVAVTRREPVSYAISDLAAERCAGRCRIVANDRAELIRVLIEANKRFHEASHDAADGLAVRFGYLESWAAPAAAAGYTGELSATNLIRQQTPGGYTTINRLNYGATTLMLCFHVTQRTGARP